MEITFAYNQGFHSHLSCTVLWVVLVNKDSLRSMGPLKHRFDWWSLLRTRYENDDVMGYTLASVHQDWAPLLDNGLSHICFGARNRNMCHSTHILLGAVGGLDGRGGESACPVSAPSSRYWTRMFNQPASSIKPVSQKPAYNAELRLVAKEMERTC